MQFGFKKRIEIIGAIHKGAAEVPLGGRGQAVSHIQMKIEKEFLVVSVDAYPID